MTLELNKEKALFPLDQPWMNSQMVSVDRSAVTWCLTWLANGIQEFAIYNIAMA